MATTNVITEAVPPRGRHFLRAMPGRVFRSISRRLPRKVDLTFQLARREIAARHKGSILGLLWAFVTPAVMIAIFTFIFAGIFGARFGASKSQWDYAVYLFCGLLPWTAFAQSVQTSANSIVSNSNLVKRVVFPVETLPAAQVLAALADQMFGTLVLLAVAVVARGRLPLTILWLPVLVLLQLMAALGAAWFVASLGVFVRDTAQGAGLVLTAWMFLTPILYPEAAVPDAYKGFVRANPFAALIANYRRVALEGEAPEFARLAYFAVFACSLMLAGYWWFRRTRRSFADVL